MPDPSKQLVLSESQIQSRVKELAAAIDRDYADKRPVLVGILKGVFRFFSDLVHEIHIPVDVEFIRISTYGMDSKSCGRVHLESDVKMDLTDRYVLVIEDIVDSGFTLDWIVDHLRKRGAKDIRICALIDKTERRECPVSLDYVGFTIEKGFLVGYGLDYAEQYRYLNEIYHLEIE